MKLILLRHAKSSWDDFTIDDHDRTLNDRGRIGAQAIGAWLKSRGHIPTHAACSTAARARETYDLVCASADITPETVFESGLYHASPDRVLRQIHKSQGDTLLLVGHNPGYAELAAMLVNKSPHHTSFNTYPTAATLVLDFDVTTWRDAKPAQGSVLDFVTPRDLAQ